MAKRRDLKKDIDYLCNAMKLETLCALFQPDVDKEKYAAFLVRIDALNVEFRNRIQHPTGAENKQLVKQYYQQVRKDFDSAGEKIYADLKTLNLEKTEN